MNQTGIVTLFGGSGLRILIRVICPSTRGSIADLRLEMKRMLVFWKQSTGSTSKVVGPMELPALRRNFERKVTWWAKTGWPD